MKEKTKDLLSGLLFLMIGGFFKFYSTTYDLGTASNMGAGYYPNLLSILLLAIGACLIIKSMLWKS
jgi:hypothetical protein